MVKRLLLILAILAVTIPAQAGIFLSSVKALEVSNKQTENFNDINNWYVIGQGFPTNTETVPSSVATGATTAVTFTSRIQYCGTGSWKRVAYGFYTANGAIGEYTLSNAVTLHGGLQAGPSASVKELTFKGATSVTSTYSVQVSDPVYSPYAYGTWDWCLTALSVANSSLLIPGGWKGVSDAGRENKGLGEGCIAGDVVLSGQSAVGDSASSGDRMYGPLCVLGYYPPGTTPPQSMLIQGDSHMAATNDPSCYGRNIGGVYVRWCSNQYGGTLDTTVGIRCPFIPLAKGAESSQQWLDNSSVVRAWARDHVTDVALEASNHDAEYGASTGTWQTALQNLVRWAAKGRHVQRVYISTAFPKATSTDNFATASNQTAIGSASRDTVNAWLRDTSASGFFGQTQFLLNSGQTLKVLDLASQFEVDSSNALTNGGGRFLVGNLSADYTGSVANLNNLSTTSARCTIGSVPAVGVLQGYTIRFGSATTTVALRNQTRNIEYDVSMSDGTRKLVFSPALSTTPAVGDVFDLFAQSDGSYKGIYTDGGIHLLKQGHAKLAKYLDGLGYMRRTSVTPQNASVAPSTPWAPTDSANLWAAYSAQSISSLYQDTGTSTPVTTDGQSVGHWIDTKNGYDVTQGTGAFCPIYKASYINSLPAVLADGTQQYLRRTTQTISQPFTILMVYKLATVTASARLFDSTDATNSVQMLASGTNRQLNAGSAANFGTFDTSAHYSIIIVNGASSKVYVDGTLVGTGSLGANNMLGLNMFTRRTTANFSNLAIGEMDFIQEDVSATSGLVTRINDYLRSTWGF